MYLTRLSFIALLLSSGMMMSACASQPTESWPDDALQNAIAEQDCRSLYELMDNDVQARFESENLFCHYYELNRDSFDAWAKKLHDRIVSGDYHHYAYLPEDPEGSMRLSNTDGTWAFESPLGTPKDPDDLKSQFMDYLWSPNFISLLKTHLSHSDPVNSAEIINISVDALRQGESAIRIQFDGPFAEITLGDRVTILYLHKKTAAAPDTWELYRCYLSR